MSKIKNKGIYAVILASSIGTLIEWYDFYIFGALEPIIAQKFFPAGNPTLATLAALATFAAGFLVRPFGAIFFGRLGDLVGRKYTFLLTLLLMGGATFAIGCVPEYSVIGMAAPIIILLLRLVQGLALGGEYGGAATYVSEHCNAKERGFYTSFIQTTATLGLFLSLSVIYLTKLLVGAEAFSEWGWRIPFIISVLLVGLSVYIRMKMQESPLFAKAKSEGKTSKNPLKESFGRKANLKIVLLALFGATAGQGVVWYTGQFYANAFIQKTMLVVDDQRIPLMLFAIVLATPFFIVFGRLSDKIGRKWIMMFGILIAVLTYRPIYSAMLNLSDVKSKTELTEKTITETKNTVSANGDSTKISIVSKSFSDGSSLKESSKITGSGAKAKTELKKEFMLSSSGWWTLMLLVFIQIFYVTMVYGPIAAFLVELFPTRIRYTSMSLPYHVGNGIFGGLTPFIATALAVSGALNGLWYPIIIGAFTFVIGAIFLSNKIDDDVSD